MVRRTYNRYILSLGALLLLSTVILSAFSGIGLDVYFTVYVIESLVLTELYVHLTPKARRELNRVNLIFFAGFLIIAASKVVEILWGIKFL